MVGHRNLRLNEIDRPITGYEGVDRRLKAYREEPGVEPASMAETYIAMQLDVDNWRWAGVPFFPPDREEAHPPHDRDRDPQENLIAPTGDRLAH